MRSGGSAAIIKGMRVSAFALLFAFGCVSAQASFDLMYLPDTNTGRVVRFDPVNNIALGSIGGFGLGATASKYASVLNANKLVYTTSSGVSVMNPNTGEVVHTGSTPNGYTRAVGDGSGYLEAFGTTLYRYDGLTYTSTSTNVGSVIRGVFGPNFAMSVALTVTGGDFVASRFNNMSLAASTTMLSAGLFTDNTFGASGGKLNSAGTSWIEVLPYQSGGVHRLLSMSMSLSTGTISSLILSPTLTAFSSAAKLTYMPAHSCYYVVGDDAANPALTRIQFHSGTGAIFSTYTTSAVDVPTSNWGGSIFLAPEPSSLTLMGLAAIALLRRRK